MGSFNKEIVVFFLLAVLMVIAGVIIAVILKTIKNVTANATIPF